MDPLERAEKRRFARACARAYAALPENDRFDVDASAEQWATDAGFPLESLGRAVAVSTARQEAISRGYARELGEAERALAAEGDTSGLCIWTDPGFRVDQSPLWLKEWGRDALKSRLEQKASVNGNGTHAPSEWHVAWKAPETEPPPSDVTEAAGW